MNPTETRERTRLLNALASGVGERVNLFGVAMAGDDIGQQEYFHKEAVAWTQKLLNELTSKGGGR